LTMVENKYLYDVAFSFLAEDEELATQLNDLIQDRVRTFLYSRRQGELAGTDGEKKFNQVFGEEARTVFVLYRENWGTTPWTRIEETAIRNRAFNDGYDFVIFTPLDSPPAVPKWLPKNRIWVGLDRWGIEGAASAIESRIQETGGIPRQETAKDKASRLQRAIKAEKEKTVFLRSEKGVQTANKEMDYLFDTLKEVVNSTSDPTNEDSLNIAFDRRKCFVYAGDFSLLIHWSQTYNDSLDSSGLYLSLWKGIIGPNGSSCFPFEKPVRISEVEFRFDINLSNKPFWQDSSNKYKFSTDELADFAITTLLKKSLSKHNNGGQTQQWGTDHE